MTSEVRSDVRLSVAGSQVISETLEGETVVINLDTGVYYSLGGTASEVWEAAVEGTALSELLAGLGSRYEGETAAVEASVHRFLDELEGDGLLRRTPGGPSAAAAPRPAAGDRLPFVPPTVQRFTDIQDLLLLDPIHEVDDSGWPNRPAGD
jgi:hypothetical protein